MDPKQLNKLTVKDLRGLLELSGLSFSGRKQELINRLIQSSAAPGSAESTVDVDDVSGTATPLVSFAPCDVPAVPPSAETPSLESTPASAAPDPCDAPAPSVIPPLVASTVPNSAAFA